MRHIIKSILLYLLIVGLLILNVYLVAVIPFSTYIIYVLIIFVVFYLNKGIFWGKRLAPGLLLGAALIGIVFAAEMLAGWIKVEGFDFNPSLFLLFFILQIIIAVGEEISFRGYILKNLIEETGIKAGICLTSFMFSAIHIPSIVYYGLDTSRGIIAFAVVGLLSAIVSIIYLKYGLVSAIGFHFSWNFLQYNIFTLAETQAGLMKSRYQVQVLFTGGNYGPEAGILGFIIALFASMILIKKYSKSLN